MENRKGKILDEIINYSKRVVRANEFIDSIGVTTHWNYPNAFKEVLKLLVESGIRHIRDGFSNKIQQIGEFGIRSAVIADLNIHSNGNRSTVEQIKDRIKSINRAGNFIDAVEGPNEPDLFWEKYKKVYSIGDTVIYMERMVLLWVQLLFKKTFYIAIKSDLLLWHEISNEDISVVPHQQLIHPIMPATLMLNRSIKQAILYTYNDSGNLIPTDVPLVDYALRFEVPHQVIVVRLTLA